jgi:DnaK suppressor protein
MEINTDHFKNMLEAELAKLTGELESVGRLNPENASDWEATPGDIDVLQSDRNEQADAIEEFEEHSAILRELEVQYNEVRAALQRIEDGTYGVCENKPGEYIPLARLEAFPSARICLEHAPKGE